MWTDNKLRDRHKYINQCVCIKLLIKHPPKVLLSFPSLTTIILSTLLKPKSVRTSINIYMYIHIPYLCQILINTYFMISFYIIPQRNILTTYPAVTYFMKYNAFLLTFYISSVIVTQVYDHTILEIFFHANMLEKSNTTHYFPSIFALRQACYT